MLRESDNVGMSGVVFGSHADIDPYTLVGGAPGGEDDTHLPCIAWLCYSLPFRSHAKLLDVVEFSMGLLAQPSNDPATPSVPCSSN